MPFQINQVGNNIVRDSHYAYSNNLGARVKTLLLESIGVNLILQSQDLTTTWTLGAATVQANNLLAPDQTLTADKLQEDGTTAAHQALQSVTKAASALPYSYSAYVFAGERTFVALTLDDGTTANGSGVFFNLTAGTAGVPSNTIGGYTAPLTAVSAGIEPLGNGWFRVSLMATSTAGTTIRGNLKLSPDGVNTSYAGTVNSGAWFWGMQLEQNAFMTSYIATTTASVTRNADVLSFAFAATPQAMSIYDKFILQHPNLLGATVDRLGVGNSTLGGGNVFFLASNGGSSGFLGGMKIAGVVTQDSAAVACNIGDTIERLVTFSATGAIQLTVSVNGAAPVVGAGVNAGSLPATFSAAQVSLACDGGECMAYQNIHIELGVQTLAYMRSAAGQ